MKVSYSKSFRHQYNTLDAKIRHRADERILLWRQDPLNPQLRNHQLEGKYKDYRSIDVTGDVRALYFTRGGEVVFDMIGTHSELYG